MLFDVWTWIIILFMGIGCMIQSALNAREKREAELVAFRNDELNYAHQKRMERWPTGAGRTISIQDTPETREQITEWLGLPKQKFGSKKKKEPLYKWMID